MVAIDDNWVAARYYKLSDRQVVPCKTYREWCDAMATTMSDEAHRVGFDQIGETTVSTVWFGIDLAYPEKPPQLFETRVVNGRYPYQRRCATWDEAEIQHRLAVALVREWSKA
jgi:hypothetical protein